MVKLNRPNRATSWRLSALLTVMAFGGACVQLLGLEPGELKGSATSSGAGGAGQGGTGGAGQGGTGGVGQGGTGGAGQGGTGGLCGDGAGGAGQGGTPLVPSFAAAVNYPVGAKPYSVTAGDWNGDKKLDLAVVNSGTTSANVSILLNNGDGTFPGTPATVSYNAVLAPVAVTAGDWNGDGKPDLAVANNKTQNVSILLGIGDGTFKTTDPDTVTVGVNPIALTAGDWNGDGKPDLAVANSGSDSVSGNVSILLGKGDGTFQAKVDYGTDKTPQSVTAGDWNGDGKPDLAVANQGSMNVSILLGGTNEDNGDWMFQAAVNYEAGTNPRSVTTRDWNGDGKLDLAVANSGSVSVSVSGNVSILLGNGNGTFQAKVDYDAGKNPRSVTTGDWNGDGHADLAVANSGSYNVSILLGNCGGTFPKKVDYMVGAQSVTASQPYSVTAGDWNGDGKLDLAVANSGSNNVSNNVSILRNTSP